MTQGLGQQQATLGFSAETQWAVRGREGGGGREGGRERKGGRGRREGGREGGREGERERRGNLGLGEAICNRESHLAMGLGIRGMWTERQLGMEHTLTL